MGFGLLAVVGAMVLMAVQSAMDDIPDPGEEVIREDDSIAGSNGDDMIDGNNASELILPHTGNDLVDGGGGNDTISDYPWDRDPDRSEVGLMNPDWGSDTLYGGAGDDVILATGGENVVDGGDGDDRINALDLHASAPYAPDLVNGGAGNDWLVGDDGDRLTGGSGTDFFTNLIDEDTDQPVLVTDYESGETVELLIYDQSLMNPDGTVPEPELRTTKSGVVLSVNGHDAAVFSEAHARDLNGNIRVLDGRLL